MPSILYVKLTRVVSAGLEGARRAGIAALRGQDPGRAPPQYAYLRVQGPTGGRFVGLDLIKLNMRGFKFHANRWLEFDPNASGILTDVWGWNPLRQMTREEIALIIDSRITAIDETIVAMQQITHKYDQLKRELYLPNTLDAANAPR